MYARQDLMRILGLSYRQLRERLAALDAIDGMLDGKIKRGHHGRTEYTPAVLEMLRKLDALAANHNLSLGQAAGEVASHVKEYTYPKSDTHGPYGNRVKGNVGSARQDVYIAPEIVIKMQAEEITWLRGRVEHLERKVDALLSLALPKPRRRWSRWLRGRPR